MSRKLRKFLLAVTSWCPPLNRWLRRYFMEHHEYEFKLERMVNGTAFGYYYPDTHTTEIFLSEIRSACPKRFLNEILRTIEHEDIHHALISLGAYGDIIHSLAMRGFRCFPPIPMVRDAVEEIVQRLECESTNHCHGSKPQHWSECEDVAIPDLCPLFYVS